MVVTSTISNAAYPASTTVSYPQTLVVITAQHLEIVDVPEELLGPLLLPLDVAEQAAVPIAQLFVFRDCLPDFGLQLLV